jgi:hypothetical protein
MNQALPNLPPMIGSDRLLHNAVLGDTVGYDCGLAFSAFVVEYRLQRRPPSGSSNRPDGGESSLRTVSRHKYVILIVRKGGKLLLNADERRNR